jgi:hypothetical protein
MTKAFRSLKKGEQLQLDGIQIDVERHDGSLASVVFTDAKGYVVKVAMASYSMGVFVPAEPEKERKTVLTGNIVGVPVRETFDDSFTACERKRELECAGASVTVADEDVEIPF